MAKTKKLLLPSLLNTKPATSNQRTFQISWGEAPEEVVEREVPGDLGVNSVRVDGDAVALLRELQEEQVLLADEGGLCLGVLQRLGVPGLGLGRGRDGRRAAHRDSLR